MKRVPVTDAQGIVVGLCVEGANRHDMKLTREALESLPASLAAKRDEWVFGAVEVLDDAALDEAVARVQEPGWEPDLEAPQREVGLCLDKGYDYQEVREVVTALGYTAHIRTRGEEQVAKAAGQKARRWVVERTHSWLNRFRRLLVRWEKKGANYLAFLHFACALITWNKALSG